MVMQGYDAMHKVLLHWAIKLDSGQEIDGLHAWGSQTVLEQLMGPMCLFALHMKAQS